MEDNYNHSSLDNQNLNDLAYVFANSNNHQDIYNNNHNSHSNNHQPSDFTHQHVNSILNQAQQVRQQPNHPRQSSTQQIQPQQIQQQQIQPHHQHTQSQDDQHGGYAHQLNDPNRNNIISHHHQHPNNANSHGAQTINNNLNISNNQSHPLDNDYKSNLNNNQSNQSNTQFINQQQIHSNDDDDDNDDSDLPRKRGPGRPRKSKGESDEGKPRKARAPRVRDDNAKATVGRYALLREKNEVDEDKRYLNEHHGIVMTTGQAVLQSHISRILLDKISDAGIGQSSGEAYGRLPNGFTSNPSTWLEPHGCDISGWPDGLPSTAIGGWTNHQLYAVLRLLLENPNNITIYRVDGKPAIRPRPFQGKRRNPNDDTGESPIRKRGKRKDDDSLGVGTSTDADAAAAAAAALQQQQLQEHHHLSSLQNQDSPLQLHRPTPNFDTIQSFHDLSQLTNHHQNSNVNVESDQNTHPALQTSHNLSGFVADLQNNGSGLQFISRNNRVVSSPPQSQSQIDNSEAIAEISRAFDIGGHNDLSNSHHPHHHQNQSPQHPHQQQSHHINHPSFQVPPSDLSN